MGCYRDSVHMKAISDGLRRELEAIATARGIDLRIADAVSHGCAVPATARYSTSRIWMPDGIQRSICSRER